LTPRACTVRALPQAAAALQEIGPAQLSRLRLKHRLIPKRKRCHGTHPRLVAKIESEPPTQRLAVLIDADNAQASVIEGLLAEVAALGEATVKRIYGDFTLPTSA
jgi:hypothetical protein